MIAHRGTDMTRRLLDLSVLLQNGIPSDPPPLLPEIEYSDHDQGVPVFQLLYPGLQRADLPEGKAGAAETVRCTTHSGTHMDAPWHYHPTQDGGRPALTIDEIPLDWCFQSGVKLDFRHFPAGYVVTAADIEAELTRIGHRLRPLDIVLVNTAAGARYGHADYVDSGCGMGREATLYLTRRGVRVCGTDGWSWDPPTRLTAHRFSQTGNAALIWEGHKAGMEIGYCHMEKLANLDQLPAKGFMVVCFPAKIHRASAGWTRAVAIIDDDSLPMPSLG
jgi:kynurenine formamidase